MQLYDIFVKPVDRTIEGVIKADDMASLRLEAEEYVITNEVSRSMENFLGAYTDYQGANGVWISGFFGSGKSHLLKMLALLLENQEIDGQSALEYFLLKVEHNAMLKGDLSRAAHIPSRSILFNIDQKADTISKKEIDAVLAVFVKVFNEMRGYYGKFGYVAHFESDLDKRGEYDAFKAAYQDVAGKDWSVGREEVMLEKSNIAKAYAQISGTSVESNKNVIDAYREEYKMSIEDFAEEVNAYIQRQEAGFRLNFFVDEIGQYIADNVKLMTNLQTIAESLATKCNGQSWVIVTAQEEMDSVLGGMSKQQTSDFSKIQDRFKTRMKLTSQNVDEVIQKRLLKKNTTGESYCQDLYGKEKNNFGTLFDFTDGATKYRGFRDEQDFVNGYPFIPYQFPLFQQAIEALSLHNAFEGQHRSVGERSMLGVFQQVAIDISQQNVGELATFDRMYKGLHAALKAQMQRSILLAEKHLDSDFAKRVLKALFLVKYVKGFNATPRNLRVLLQERFDQDVAVLRKEVEEALALLEQQTYIQRNGETYEYLTEDEKDIEQEIKSTNIDSGDTSKALEELLFTMMDRKIRYDVTKQDYPFTKKLDDKIIGREYELTVHFISPFSENVNNIDLLKGYSLGRPELMIVMSANARFIQDLRYYKQTEKYIRINHSTTQRESVRGILGNKGIQNTERFKKIQAQAYELISQARFLVSGEEAEIAGTDPKTRIVKGCNELVSRTYPNLRMLKTSYSENEIRKYLDLSKGSMFGGDDLSLGEAEQEILGFVQSNKNAGTRITLKSIEEHFSKKPYGWYLAAMQCLVAQLVGRGKIEASADSNILEDADLERALKNTYGFGNIILSPQEVVSPPKIRWLKDFYRNFFDRPATANEAKALGAETRDSLREMLAELRELAAQKMQYPFLDTLAQPIQTLSELTGKDYAYYFNELPSREDELLNMKEDLLDPVRRFMSGSNREIYDDVRQFMQMQQSNFAAVGEGKLAELQAILTAPNSFKGNQMRDAKRLMDSLKSEVETQLKAQKDEALRKISDLQGRMQAMQEYGELDASQQTEIEQSFSYVTEQIKRQNLISGVRDQAAQYETHGYSDLLTKISIWTKPTPEDKPIEYVSQRQLDLRFERPYLADEADVEAYLAALKEAMLAAIKTNKRIRY